MFVNQLIYENLDMHNINTDGGWSNFDTAFLTGKTDSQKKWTLEFFCMNFTAILMSENCKVHEQFEVKIWTILTYIFLPIKG